MCLILFAWQADPRYRLVLAANRDEFFARPSVPAGYWHDAPQVLGGRDLEKGGSWLAVDRSGRWAAVTNFRDGGLVGQAARSRGSLVGDYIRSKTQPHDYLRALAADDHDYAGFSLLIADPQSLQYTSNRGAVAGASVTPGVHGLSNHLLDTPWPKVQRGRLRLEALLGACEATLVEGLFETLLDRQPAQDDELPSSGVGRERERALSPAFISAGDYGTRASTVM
ncbi:MAG: NRDE family protein, partial [Burkholderiales bacterium]